MEENIFDDGFQTLLKNAEANKFSSEDIEKLKKAHELAEKAHDGQFRKSGEPYIIHPVSVAIILSGMNMDCDSLCAALLHDVVEDTPYTSEDIKKQFIKQIEDANKKNKELLEQVGKLNKQAEEQRKANTENLKKIQEENAKAHQKQLEENKKNLEAYVNTLKSREEE